MIENVIKKCNRTISGDWMGNLDAYDLKSHIEELKVCVKDLACIVQILLKEREQKKR